MCTMLTCSFFVTSYRKKKIKYSFGTYKCYLIKMNLNLQKQKKKNEIFT